MTTEQMYEAVSQRDGSQDGKWFVGVMTTGVFCKPSCPARTPKRLNVAFFETAESAIAAGLRPCLRCHPTSEKPRGPQATAMRKLARFIRTHADESLPLERLAELASLSPTHLQRVFKESIGVSPKTYAEACRMSNLRRLLRERPAGDAIVAAGYSSPSRVYEKVDGRLGMTPEQYRQGGHGIAISYAFTDSVLGPLMMAATDRGICFVQFGDSQDQLVTQLRAEYPRAEIGPMTEANSHFVRWMDLLSRHLAGDLQTFRDLPLDVRGTSFQAKVWAYLQSIPSGEIRSYSEVAEGIGLPRAVRAVASACAKNSVAVIIPCHRVLRGTGELGGYRWGLDRKRTLIDAERTGERTGERA